MPNRHVTVIGAGLAGAELALQLAARGFLVRLVEQKPGRRSAAQSSHLFCELVCSNSLRGVALTNAVGLLKEEMRRIGSFVMRAADATRVPAGGALAVDRGQFSHLMTTWLRADPSIEIIEQELPELPPERPIVVCTGPLTADSLARDLERRLGTDAIAYYDAIAPIVSAGSIDQDKVFSASRWDKGPDEASQRAYLNCPFEKDEYFAFVGAILGAEKVVPHRFEEPKYFEGCLPIEVMAERGARTLAFGPMKPVGIIDPRTGRRPYAVVQLRREDVAGTAYNLVGFQTRMTQPAQDRVLRMIPGLERAEFLRFGSVHRNTFIDAPRVLDGFLRWRGDAGLWFAGQLTGVEGYVESAASGLAAALLLSDQAQARPLELPPATTALGGLLRHLSTVQPSFQPTNVTYALVPPIEHQGKKLTKEHRGQALAARALADLEAYWSIRRGDVLSHQPGDGAVGQEPG
jgi:methylenetetrahydrofolate--tRNA-(uracil-5-)-methyltransferase